MPSDKEFENLYNQYLLVEKNLRKVVENGKNVAKSVDKWCESNYSASQSMVQFVNTNQTVEYDDGDEFKQNVLDLGSYYESEFSQSRKAILCVINKRVVNGIEQFLKDGTNGIESIYKQRKNILLDYDSHLQKAAAYSKKEVTVQSTRFQMKADHDKSMLHDFTEYLEKRLHEFVRIGRSLLQTESAVLLSCELFLLKHQYDALSEIGNNMGEDLLFPVLNDLDEICDRLNEFPNEEIQYNLPSTGLSIYPASEYPVFVSFNDYIKQAGAIQQPVGMKGKGKEKKRRVKGDSSVDGSVDTVSKQRRRVKGGSSVDGSVDETPKQRRRVKGGSSVDDSLSVDSVQKQKRRVTEASPMDDSIDETPRQRRRVTESSPMDDSLSIDSAHTTSSHYSHHQHNNPNFLSQQNETPSWMDDIESWGFQTEQPNEDDQTNEDEQYNEDDQTYEDDLSDQSDSSDDYYIGMKVKALYSCKSDEDGDLQFKKGDIIVVTQFFKGGWWMGECRGQTGIFPSNYVKPL